MKPSKQLVEALRRAASHIEQFGSDYDWSDTFRCNCGQLARQLINPVELSDLMFGHGETGCWAERDTYGHCHVTGKPVGKVVAALAVFGLERGDLTELENLSNERVRERAGMTGETIFRRSEQAFVARYFRAQADLLEEQLAQPKPAPVQQECCHMWLEATQTCLYCCASKLVVPVEVGCE